MIVAQRLINGSGNRHADSMAFITTSGGILVPLLTPMKICRIMNLPAPRHELTYCLEMLILVWYSRSHQSLPYFI